MTLTAAAVVSSTDKAARSIVRLEEDRQDHEVATDQLTSLQNKMTFYEKEEDDSEVIDWKTSMVVTKQLKQYQLNAVKDLIEAKLNAIPPEG